MAGSKFVSKIRKSVYGMIVKGFGDSLDTVIRADGDGQRPSELYATYKVSITEDDGLSEIRYQKDGNIHQYDRFFINVSVQAYGKGAMDAMHDLRTRLKSKSFKDQCAIDFRDAELCAVILDTGSITDLAELLESTFDERAQMDLRLSLTQVTIDCGQDEKGLAIKKISFGGTLQTPENEIEIKETEIVN